MAFSADLKECHSSSLSAVSTWGTEQILYIMLDMKRNLIQSIFYM
jgi:hypothetical protein